MCFSCPHGKVSESQHWLQNVPVNRKPEYPGHLPSLGVTPTYVKMCLFVHAHILAPSEEIREGNTATQSHLADMEGGMSCDCAL